MHPQIAPNENPPSLLVSRIEACRLMGISLRTLEKLILAGEVPSVQMRRRRLIPRDFLERLARGVEE